MLILMSRRIISVLSSPIFQNLVAIVVTIFFLVFIILFSLLPAIHKAEDDAVDLQEKTAIDAQHLVDLFIQTRFQNIDTIGNNIWFWYAHKETSDKKHTPHDKDIEAITNIFFNSNTDFINVSLLDSNGKTSISVDKPGIIDPTSFASLKDSMSFKEAFEKGENYISPVYFSSQGPVLEFALPLKENGKIIGVITADIDFTILWKIAKTPQVTDGKIYLVDTRGYIIADPDPIKSISGENLKYRDVVSKLIEGEDRIKLSTYINEDKVPVISYGLKNPTTNWGIIVEQNLITAMLQKDRTTNIALGFSGISSVLIIFLLLGTYRLVKALVKLKQEEEIISSERNKLAVTLAGISDAVIALDLNREIVIFNKAAETLTGYKSADIIGKDLSYTIRVYEEDKEIPSEIYSPIQKSLFEGVVFSKNGLRIKTSKKETYVNLLVGHIAEGLSTHLGCILTLHDVTEEKQLEHMKVDFVSMAAHELRTPLTIIIGYLTSLDVQSKSKLDEEEQVFVERSLSSARQLNELVNDLLSISKVENRVMTVAHKTIDWEQQLLNLLENFKSIASQKNITIALHIPNNIPQVSADPIKINEVLNNLLENALKYTEPKGTIDIFVKIEKDFIVTSVKDTGAGIPEDSIPHLFTKFYRVYGALDTSSNSQGSGLGLYISKAIIDAHAGKIWVESVLGKGSTFSFSLPLIQNLPIVENTLDNKSENG